MSEFEDLSVMEEVRVIELHMMTPHKYYPLTTISSICLRNLLYPFNVLKTRLQLQMGKNVYNSTFHAVSSIWKTEGIKGLYRGCLVYNMHIIPSVAYIITYENTRKYTNNFVSLNSQKSFFGGMTASFVGQSIAIPIDIVSQHLMLIGDGRKVACSTSLAVKLKTLQEIDIQAELRSTRFGPLKAVISHIYTKDGLKGFYKGYLVSLAQFAPNSALWWFFYDAYSEFWMSALPGSVSRLFIQCLFSAPLAGISACIITQPLDVIRTRMQVKGESFRKTTTRLWEEDGARFYLKGLSPRLVQSGINSLFVMLGYETIKRLSLKEEYKNSVRW